MDSNRTFPLIVAASIFSAALCVVASLTIDGGGQPSPMAEPKDSTPSAMAPAADSSPVVVRSAAARSPYQLAPGERFALDVETKTSAVLRQGTNPEVTLQARVEGRMEIEVLAQRASDLALLLAVAEPLVQVANADPAAIRSLRGTLAHGVVVRLGHDGTVLGYRFPDIATAEHRNLLRTIVSALRAEVGDGATEFVASDADATGTATIEGCWNPERTQLRRAKRSYESTGNVTPQVDGRGFAVLDPAIGWWAETKWTERAIIHLEDAQVHVEAKATIDSNLVAGSWRTGGSHASFDWDAPWVAASGAFDHETPAVDPIEAALASELRGVSLRSILSQAEALLSGSGSDQDLFAARQRLIWLLRNDPSALLELAALLTEGRASTALIAEALSAAGAARTEATQRFLARVAIETDATAVRVAALQALFQVDAAQPETCAALARIQSDPNAAPEVVGTSFLLQGALAGLGSSDETLIRALLDMEGTAVQRGLLVDWLEALGNSGHPTALQPGLRYLASVDWRERAAATSALRQLSDERSLAALAETATRDRDAAVRMMAIEALADRPGPVAFAALQCAARDDADVSVRAAGVHALGHRTERAAVQRTLQWIAGNDPSPRIRALALDAAARMGS